MEVDKLGGMRVVRGEFLNADEALNNDRKRMKYIDRILSTKMSRI